MTREEAIKELSEWLAACCGGEEIEPTREALRMAIEALKAQIDKDINVPSNDLISRQAAIDALNKEIIKRRLLDDVNDGMLDEFDTEDILRKLPSAQPKLKTGKWIYGEHDVAMCDGYRCNKCGFFVPWDYKHKSIDYIKDYHFCPNCGAKMEEGE